MVMHIFSHLPVFLLYVYYMRRRHNTSPCQSSKASRIGVFPLGKESVQLPFPCLAAFQYSSYHVIPFFVKPRRHIAGWVAPRFCATGCHTLAER